MTGRPRSPGGGGSHGDTSTTRTPGGGEETSGGRQRTHSGNASHVADGEAAVADALRAGRVQNPNGSTPGRVDASGTARSPVLSTITGEPLKPGYRYDANERLHGPNGKYAKDPTAPPGAHNRDSEYPGGYRDSTHDEMARRYTVEGRRHGKWPRGPDGKRVPKENLTWTNKKGKVIKIPPGDEITYDHKKPVVRDWNENGRLRDRQYRDDWYNNVDNLRPELKSKNSSGGAKLGITYRQDTGEGYSS